MDEMSKFGIIVVPITWAIGAIVAIILGIWGPDRWWLSYLLGLMTALLNFGLMMKSNRRLAEKTKNQEEIKPKRIALTGYFVRIIVFVAIFTAVCYSQFKTENPRFFAIPMIIGYLTLKLVVIAYGIIKRGKVNS